MNRLKIVLMLLAGIFGLGMITASPASASSPPAGYYHGSPCLNYGATHYIDNSGAEACYWNDGFVHNSYFKFADAAYDYASDGLSARTVLYAQQLINGSWVNTGTYTVTTSKGYGYGYVSPIYTQYRKTGATYFRFKMYACTYDQPSATYHSCAYHYYTSAW